jgi:inosine/xanthosine triphosphatase
MPIVTVASGNSVKLDAVERAFEKVFDDLSYTINSGDFPSGVSNQPKSQAETRQGAENRARNAWKASHADFTVGIEGGIEDTPQGMASFAWVAIYDGEQMSCAVTALYYLPLEVASLIRQGLELGYADDKVFGQTDSKLTNGSVGLLTGDVITRTDYYEHAVVFALIPFKNKKFTWPAPAPVLEEKRPSFYQPKPGEFPHIGENDLYILKKLTDDVYGEAFDEKEGKNVEWVGGLQEAVYMHVNDMLAVKDAAITALKTPQNPDAQQILTEFLNCHIDYRDIRAEIAKSEARGEPISQDYAEEKTRSDQGFMAQAARLAEALNKGTVVLPGGPRDKVIQDLRRDVELQGKMIDIKNGQVVSLTNDLRNATKRITDIEAGDAETLRKERDAALNEARGYRDLLSRTVLERNEAYLAMTNLLLDQAKAQSETVPEPVSEMLTVYKSLMQDMSSPLERSTADAELKANCNGENPWRIDYMVVMRATGSYQRYVLLKREIPSDPQPVPQEEAKAEATAPIPEPAPQPALDHTIIVGTPETPERVITGHQPVDLELLEKPGGATALSSTSNRFPVRQALIELGGNGLKAAMNTHYINVGATAAAAKYAELTANDDDAPLSQSALPASKAWDADKFWKEVDAYDANHADADYITSL